VTGDRLSDEELLAGTPGEPDLFGAFYRRREDAVLGYMVRRVGDPELAADLTAEVFAAALLSVRRFRGTEGPAVAWLFGIARNVLGRSLERRQVEDRARRKLRMAPVAFAPDVLETIAALDGEAFVGGLLAELPAGEAAAVQARVIDGTDYAQIASDLRCSEQVVRKRVSRGLERLRKGMPA
jgi:RNA polymerase sigma-70 factor (ECF subfamily)